MILHGHLQCSEVKMRSISKTSLECLPGEANSFHDAGGSQHKSYSSMPLGRAQLIQILQGLYPTAKSLAELYKDLFVLGPLPIHGKPQNVSCH